PVPTSGMRRGDVAGRHSWRGASPLRVSWTHAVYGPGVHSLATRSEELIMWIRLGAVLAGVLLTLAACDSRSVMDSPDTGALAIAVGRPQFSGDACYVYRPAQWLGGVPTDPSIIASNCSQEACGQADVGEGLGVVVDPLGMNDVAQIRCPGGSIVGIPSSEPCWECLEGCAGNACPPGRILHDDPGPARVGLRRLHVSAGIRDRAAK